MTIGTPICPNCGSQVTQEAGFCASCGARLSTSSPAGSQAQPSYHSTITAPRPPVSTGLYKVAIAVLLVIILILGIGYFTGSAHSLFSLGNYRYQLANPPSVLSTQPAPAHTSQIPAFTIWNACGSSQSAGCTMTASGWREGSVPDTFDYYVAFTSTVNVTVYFFTMGQFVQFSVCNGDVSCVSGSYDSIPATTNVTPYTLFTLGEGCADYLAIYVASGTGVMHPNVGVDRPNVSPSGPTGYCAQVGG